MSSAWFDSRYGVTYKYGKYIYSKIHRLKNDECFCEKVQVINQSHSLAEDLFGLNIRGMVYRNDHCVLLFLIFLSPQSLLSSQSTKIFGSFSLFEPDGPSYYSDVPFPPKKMSS